jgi:hypothetical protein
MNGLCCNASCRRLEWRRRRRQDEFVNRTCSATDGDLIYLSNLGQLGPEELPAQCPFSGSSNKNGSMK